MPQIETTTFITLFYWTFIIYLIIDLELEMSDIFEIFTQIKIKSKKSIIILKGLNINEKKLNSLVSSIGI